MPQSLTFSATHDPMPGVLNPGPHQTYRNPTLVIKPRPLLPLSTGSLRVQPLLVGVCGTDLHTVRANPETGYIRSSAPMTCGADGRVLGHEGVARVLQVGTAVTGFTAGDIVAFASVLACGHCPTCAKGLANYCESSQLLGLEFDGLYSHVADVPAKLAFCINDLAQENDERGLRAACCMEPAACAYLALQRANLQPGERLLILGAGPIGLFCAMLAKHVFEASSVEVVEPLENRAQQVKPWADQVFSTLSPERRQVDVVVEASGDLSGLDTIIERMGPGARLLLLARGGQPLSIHRVDALISRGLQIVTSRGHLGACEQVLQLIRDRAVPIENAVTGEVEGLAALREELLSHDPPLEQRHTKLIARLGRL